MIGRLRGEVIDRTTACVVVDVSGIGYEVTVAGRTHYALGQRVDLHIHTHVREDALQLFGFQSPLERELFHHLIRVPNVGPVKAMAILETPPEEIVRAVRSRQPAALAKLPGIGKKTAERLMVDLGDKLDGLWASFGASRGSELVEGPAGTGLGEDLVSALVNLGFRPGPAEDAAKASLERLGRDAELSVLLKDAIASVAR